jgi:ankyrin repeat protein
MRMAFDLGINVNQTGRDIYNNAVRDAESYDVTPLHAVCMYGTAWAFPLLLEAGADLNAVDAEGNTPLLLSAGADVHAAGEPGRTALHVACMEDGAWAFPLLLEAGADVNAVDAEGSTPLHTSCFGGFDWPIPLLLEAGADVNALNMSRRTPLEYACACADSRTLLQVMTPLLAAGARVKSEEKDNIDGSALEKLVQRYTQTNEYAVSERLSSIGAAIATLVIAGDHRLHLIPTPCAGLDAALVALLTEKQTDLLPGIFQRLEPAVQGRVRTGLLVLKRFCGKMQDELCWSIIAAALS